MQFGCPDKQQEGKQILQMKTAPVTDPRFFSFPLADLLPYLIFGNPLVSVSIYFILFLWVSLNVMEE